MTEKNIIIQSSFLLINCRQYIISAKRKTELNDEFIVFPIDIDNETKLIYLSFKHVLRIEIMNNGNTAGLALHVDEFMAEKFQYLLKDGGTVLPQSPDSPKRSVVFDILNADPQKLTTIREILQSAGLFRHNYVVKQIRKNRRFRIANPTTLPFISTISELQWNSILDNLGFGKTALIKEEPSDVDVPVSRQFFPPPPGRSRSVGAAAVAVSQDEPPVSFFNNPIEYRNRVNRPPGIGKPPPGPRAHTSSKLPVSQFRRIGHPAGHSAADPDLALMNGMPRKKVVQSGGQWQHAHGDKQRENSQMATGGGGGGNYAENNGQSENAMSDAERLKELAGIPAEKELWIETRNVQGEAYFHHAETLEGTWERPEAANTIVMTKDELLELAKREEAKQKAKLQLQLMAVNGIPGYGYVSSPPAPAAAASTSTATFSSIVNPLELEMEDPGQWPDEDWLWQQYAEEQEKSLKRKMPEERNWQMPTDENEIGKEPKRNAAIECSHQQMEPSPGPGDGLWSHLTKRLFNPESNHWNEAGGTKVKISQDGLYALNDTRLEGMDVFAVQPFPIATEHARMDFFPGTILYYFEVKHLASSFNLWGFYVGLSDGIIPEGSMIGCSPHFYGLPDNCDFCFLEGEKHSFQWLQGAIKPKWKDQGNVVGCGIMISPKDNVSIFFTLNGQLMGKQMPIRPSIGRLFPTLTMWNSSFEADFGNDPTKPFTYDINKCQGLVFDKN